MTKAQQRVMIRLVRSETELDYVPGIGFGYEEVGRINGIDPRTARALCEMGKAEMTNGGDGRGWIRLRQEDDS